MDKTYHTMFGCSFPSFLDQRGSSGSEQRPQVHGGELYILKKALRSLFLAVCSSL